MGFSFEFFFLWEMDIINFIYLLMVCKLGDTKDKKLLRLKSSDEIIIKVIFHKCK